MTIDRVQIATRDAKSVAGAWRHRLGAEELSCDSIKALRARRTTLCVGVNYIARIFGLNTENFVTITSELFGYTGVLTLFSVDRLDRFEVITPTDITKTLGRYYKREAASFYMTYAESREIGNIQRAAKTDGAGLTLDPREKQQEGRDLEQIWLHPGALNGIMLGISRPTLAWRWSGHPKRVEALG